MTAEELHRVEKMSRGADRRENLQPVLLARIEVVGAMSRRGVHGAGAGFERDIGAEHTQRIAVI